MKSQTQSGYDLENGGELGIAGRGKRLVQTLSPQTCFSCDVGHSLSAGNVTQCGCHEGRIALIKRHLEIGGHVFLRLEVVCGFPGCRCCLGHSVALTSRALLLCSAKMILALVGFAPPASQVYFRRRQ